MSALPRWCWPGWLLAGAWGLAAASETSPPGSPAVDAPSAEVADSEEPVGKVPPQEATAEGVPALRVTEAGPQLLVEDLRPGVGAEAAFGVSLAVHYTGWLYEADALGHRGRQFDSSRERGNPLVFLLGAGRVIKGWDLGLVGLRVGGLRRLVIPPELAYGSRSVGDGLIPPGSTLVFEVELVGVESNTLSENTR